jgi:hypothetical protein
MNDADIISRAQNILSLSRTIRHYEESLAQAQGTHFNLFEILHIGHYEVRTHSPIIAELLNPTGTHGQGCAFLRKFLSLLNIGEHEFDVNGASVQTEVSVGTYGRIDIAIIDRRRRRIYIENKIYARFQDKQLEHYQAHDPDAWIVLLTLNGDEPINTDLAIVTKLKRLSYKNDILTWLEECRKEATTAPTVRESISQYIHLIKRLTNQKPNSYMNSELSKTILANKENLLAYFALCNAKDDIKKELLNWVTEELRKIATELGLEMSTENLMDKYGKFTFTHPALEQANIAICLQFDRNGLQDLDAGFAYIDHTKGSPSKDILKAKLCEARKCTIDQTDWWPAFFTWSKYRNWTDGETLAAIRYGEFLHDAKELLQQLLDVAKVAIAHEP